MQLDKPLAPGATIGILGGGQLGRMLALAAARLGFKCHIYAPEAGSPAFQVSAAHTVGAYTDFAALESFAATVDVVTYEFENVPGETAAFLETRVSLNPSAHALRIAQDRVEEKTFIAGLGLPVAPFAAVSDEASLDAAIAKIGRPAVLKTRRFGYDGKGQTKIAAGISAAAAWAE
ncbi:MAG: ATP-grasp domain-containing protein, partial [Methylocella sp.]